MSESDCSTQNTHLCRRGSTLNDDLVHSAARQSLAQARPTPALSCWMNAVTRCVKEAPAPASDTLTNVLPLGTQAGEVNKAEPAADPTKVQDHVILEGAGLLGSQLFLERLPETSNRQSQFRREIRGGMGRAFRSVQAMKPCEQRCCEAVQEREPCSMQ